MLGLMMIAAAVIAPPPPQADERKVTLTPETAVSLAFDDGGNWTAVPRTSTAPSADTRSNAVALQSAPEARTAETMTQLALPDAERPAPGRIEISLHRLDGRPGELLILANGYGRRLVYRAVLVRNGVQTPTTVCAVRPGMSGIETWPYAVDAVELGGFVQSDTAPADC